MCHKTAVPPLRCALSSLLLGHVSVAGGAQRAQVLEAAGAAASKHRHNVVCT
jgi:hypothetical protein